MTETGDTLRKIRDHARWAMDQMAQIVREAEGCSIPVQEPLKPASNTVEDHIRAHRPGRPAKLDTDPELRDFVLNRLDHMTFPQLEQAVAQTFPPDRRIRKSAIHKWWVRNGRPGRKPSPSAAKGVRHD